MDLWVAAAAAGAGYLAKYWQKAIKDSAEGSSDSVNRDSKLAMPLDEQLRRKGAESGSPLFRSLIRKQGDEGIVSSELDGRHLETLSGEYVRDNSSLLSLQPWIFRRESLRNDGEGMEESSDLSDRHGHDMCEHTNGFQPPFSPRNVGPGYGFTRSKSSLRSRWARRCPVKPLTSLENCLIPELYKGHVEFEDYVSSSFSTPSSPALRPFVITDGNRIISKSSYDPSGMQFRSSLHREPDGVDSGVKETVFGIPALPELRQSKRKTVEAEHGRFFSSSIRQAPKISHLPGSLDGMLLFCLGVSIGVMSTVQSNRREVERLNDLLKHTENLVQDLQEELEMKDSLTVKELVNEACENHEHHDSSSNVEEQITSSPRQAPELCSVKQERHEFDHPSFSRTGDDVVSLSNIEAELEAELERLEQNMNASSLEGRMSALAELDPDLIADVVQGELRAELLHRKHGGREADSDIESNGTSTTHTHTGNYSVSPRELSLRLHELIQSQLEERIKELETALYQSQKQIHFMAGDQVNSQGAYSNSDLGSSSNQESPIMLEQGQGMDSPLCLNLSGDALDAYNEVYEEFLRMAETEEGDSPYAANMSEQINGVEVCPSDKSLSSRQEDQTNEFIKDLKIFEREPTRKQIPSHQEAEEELEDYDFDDEEGRILIQQIVEKTRQGSPVVINAQKILFSMDE